MTSLINRSCTLLIDLKNEMTQTTSDLKTGVLWLADGTSHVLYDLANIEKNGLAYTLKFAITAFKLASISHRTLFNSVSKDFEVLFSLYQSRNFLNANIVLLRFRELTPSKLLMAIVSYVSLFQFLKKTGVISNNVVSRLPSDHDIGSFKLKELIIFSKPREISIVVISLLDIYSTLPTIRGSSLSRFASELQQTADLVFLLRIAANLGRISALLLSLFRYGKYAEKELILGMIASSASIARYLLVCSKEREARMYDPDFTANNLTERVV